MLIGPGQGDSDDMVSDHRLDQGLLDDTVGEPVAFYSARTRDASAGKPAGELLSDPMNIVGTAAFPRL